MSARRPSSVQKPKSGAIQIGVPSKSSTLLQCSIDQCSEAVLRISTSSGSRKKLRRHEVTLRLRACHTSGLRSSVHSSSQSPRLLAFPPSPPSPHDPHSPPTP